MEKILKLIKDLTWYNKVEKSKEILRLLTTIFLQDAPEDGNIYGRKDGEWEEVTASTSTPTLLEVLTEGNEAPDVDAKIKRIGLYNIPEAEYNYIEAFDTEWRFLNANPDRNFKFDVNTLQGEKLYSVINQDGAIPIKTIQNSNFTAVGYAEYSTISNLTITDPTPIEGMGYMVTVINGTATIGGVGYTVGQKVFRHFHSGSWRSFVYGSSSTAQTASNFANDTEAASGGVQIGQLYHTAGVVKIRLS
jgi:hypothetical protein